MITFEITKLNAFLLKSMNMHVVKYSFNKKAASL